MKALVVALRDVEALLGAYPRPQTEPCGCEACAEDARLIRQGMTKRPAELSREEIRAAVCSAYKTWCAEWPQVAHFIPAALRYMADDSAFDLFLDLDPERILKQLLVSARPEFAPEFAPESPMPAPDRRALFDALAALLLHRAVAPEASRLSEELANLLGFLAQFDAPLRPVLDAWENHPESLARARLCAVMAAHAVHTSRRSFFGNTYLDGAYRPLAENTEPMDALFAPSHVARYILTHTDDLACLSDEAASAVEVGWHVAAAAGM